MTKTESSNLENFWKKIYYETMYDVDNAKQYDEFFEGMLELNNRMKEEAEQQNQPTNLKLPKLKKVD